MDSTPAIKIYLREISGTPLLTADDEVALAQRIEAGCMDARELLIKSNLRLVVKIARDYDFLALPFLDLVSEGNIGLMKAVERFDWRRGLKFSNLATLFINEAIKKSITDKSRLIRVPQSAVVKMRKRFAEGGEMDVAMESPVSLDSRADAGGASMLERLAMPETKPDTGPDPMLKPLLGRALNVLTAREQEVISARFGMKGGGEESLRAVGKKLGLSYERVRQIQSEALEKLRAVAESLGMREYL